MLINITLDESIKKISINGMIGKRICRIGKLDNILLEFFKCRPIIIIGYRHSYMLFRLHRKWSHGLLDYVTV